MLTEAHRRRKASLDALLLDLPGVVGGRMFGSVAYYVNGRMFACIYGDGVGLRVPGGVADALIEAGRVAPFQPHGRSRMREWIHIQRPRSTDHKKDLTVLRIAFEFVRDLQPSNRKSK